MSDLDEAIKEAVWAFTAAVGKNHPSKAALASLRASGWDVVPKHTPHWAVDWPEDDGAAQKP